jgi:hypothetical protein
MVIVVFSGVIYRQCLPLVLVALRLEAKLNDSGDGLARTYLRILIPRMFAEISVVANIEDEEARIAAARGLVNRRFVFPPGYGRGPIVIICAAIVAQVIFAYASLKWFDYRFM